jgi:hypothetical protein
MVQPEENAVKSETFINVRKLAALDIVFHGSRLILAEFALGMVLCAIFGLWSFLSPIHSPFMIVIGCFLMWVALNYVPLLLYAISIVRRKSAQQEEVRNIVCKIPSQPMEGALTRILVVREMPTCRQVAPQPLQHGQQRCVVSLRLKSLPCSAKRRKITGEKRSFAISKKGEEDASHSPPGTGDRGNTSGGNHHKGPRTR